MLYPVELRDHVSRVRERVETQVQRCEIANALPLGKTAYLMTDFANRAQSSFLSCYTRHLEGALGTSLLLTLSMGSSVSNAQCSRKLRAPMCPCSPRSESVRPSRNGHTSSTKDLHVGLGIDRRPAFADVAQAQIQQSWTLRFCPS